MSKRHSEAAFETVIEANLLANGYVSVDRDSFDRERAIFPKTERFELPMTNSTNNSMTC